MTLTRKLAAATSVVLLAASGVAAAADAPIVSAQHTSTATKAPLTIPGTGIQKGERLPTARVSSTATSPCKAARRRGSR
jgi:hypothetical protein